MDHNLDLNKFLWKKRLILIKNNLSNLSHIKEVLKKNKNKLIKNKIEYFFLDHEFSNNIALIGLDGQVKYKSNTLNLEKIFHLISQMPLANY